MGGLDNITLCVGVSHGVCEIYVRSGDVVDQIKLVRRDGTTSQCGKSRGVNRDPFKLEPNEYITEVAWWSKNYYGDDCLHGIRFTTNTGRMSGTYGHDGESWITERADEGEQVSGLEMRADCRGFVGGITKVI